MPDGYIRVDPVKPVQQCPFVLINAAEVSPLTQITPDQAFQVSLMVVSGFALAWVYKQLGRFFSPEMD